MPPRRLLIPRPKPAEGDTLRLRLGEEGRPSLQGERNHRSLLDGVEGDHRHLSEEAERDHHRHSDEEEEGDRRHLFDEVDGDHRHRYEEGEGGHLHHFTEAEGEGRDRRHRFEDEVVGRHRLYEDEVGGRLLLFQDVEAEGTAASPYPMTKYVPRSLLLVRLNQLLPDGRVPTATPHLLDDEAEGIVATPHLPDDEAEGIVAILHRLDTRKTRNVGLWNPRRRGGHRRLDD